jgi:benzoyl-CoA reductase/2-hydroxyglutaryl-CoA dehydratase subunit BcrC/BadD/HgdB
LNRSIALFNEQRRLLAELKRHWLGRRLNTLVYRRLRRAALTQDPVAANETLKQTLGQLKEDEQVPADPPPILCLLLLAELAAPDGLVRLVEAQGAQVVIEDSDLDERNLAELIPDDAHTVEEALLALAHAYLSKPPGPRMRDLPRRLTFLSQLIVERGVQAAVCAYSVFCDLYLAEYPSLKRHLEGLGIPVLLLELEDDTVSGQQRTRVEAFMEMMQKN